MSILIVGSEKKFTLENFYKENLIKCGEQCDIYPIKDLISDKYFKSIFRKVLFKLFKKAIILANNRKLIKRVKDLKPSFIIIFKGMYVLPRTILKLKNECFISNYNADHPFIFSSKGSGNSNVTKSISLYDLHLTYHPKVKKLIENKYGITTEIVPFGYEFEMTPYGERQSEDFVIAKFIAAAKRNDDLTIFGDGLQTRTFCYIKDNIDFTLKILKDKTLINEVVNVGHHEQKTLLETANTIKRVLGSESKIVHLPALEDGDMKRRQPDNSKMLSVLGRELTPFEEGLKKLL